MQNKKIKYQLFEQKYLKSIIECINQCKGQSGAYDKDLGIYEEVTEDNCIFKLYPESCNTTIIAVDESKGDFVCGICPGIQLLNYMQDLRQECFENIVNERNLLDLQLLEPLIELNKYNKESLMIMNFGVRQGYENLKIGSNLIYLFSLNAKRLGYYLAAGLVYNPKSAHVFYKQNYQLFGQLDLIQQNLSEEIKQKVKSKYMFLMINLVQKSISDSKTQPTVQQSRL
ncbi:hypothetical protein TTHERM_00954190 (macronuclear) [Tetrahymena thermophila SB210]|uniref:Uncharacterized protein n=1 Tax=Tetrahymena thermophila (strain SB210) TaxID=312017 RepID=Q23MP5_TETTS|nr:hypothetical protein TTHERM_00954190 [Tetrahymena thermophila SB210]EAR97797.1 hypothetical protein TTHERM_00954190 [Tetrahymena thermophila SB210]|eukprot:XP_001018042.1 hypothetical protein TTHERM_00954190 [Tetrahymena thermophila SB210]